jgi:hypothetical protein
MHRINRIRRIQEANLSILSILRIHVESCLSSCLCVFVVRLFVSSSFLFGFRLHQIHRVGVGHHFRADLLR